MKTLSWIIGLIFITGMISAHEVKTNTKSDSTKVLRKQARIAQLEKKYKSLEQLLHSKKFVLEADYLSNLEGRRIIVNSMLNFVKVDTTTAILQIGRDGRLGANGVGGITAKGSILNWKLKENPRHKSFYLTMTVLTPIGIYDVNANISASGYAEANISGTTRGQLNYIGRIVSMDKTITYTGESI